MPLLWLVNILLVHGVNYQRDNCEHGRQCEYWNTHFTYSFVKYPECFSHK